MPGLWQCRTSMALPAETTGHAKGVVGHPKALQQHSWESIAQRLWQDMFIQDKSGISCPHKKINLNQPWLKSGPLGIGGRGKLTNDRIAVLTNLYSKAPRDNKGDAEKMGKATIAILKHYSSTPEKPMHQIVQNVRPLGVHSKLLWPAHTHSEPISCWTCTRCLSQLSKNLEALNFWQAARTV